MSKQPEGWRPPDIGLRRMTEIERAELMELLNTAKHADENVATIAAAVRAHFIVTDGDAERIAKTERELGDMESTLGKYRVAYDLIREELAAVKQEAATAKKAEQELNLLHERLCESLGLSNGASSIDILQHVEALVP